MAEAHSTASGEDKGSTVDRLTALARLSFITLTGVFALTVAELKAAGVKGGLIRADHIIPSDPTGETYRAGDVSTDKLGPIRELTATDLIVVTCLAAVAIIAPVTATKVSILYAWTRIRHHDARADASFAAATIHPLI
jgi:hypothetical protein